MSGCQAREALRRGAEDGYKEGPKPRTEGSARTPRWDNIRFVAGSLVLFVHMASPLTELEGIRWIHIATWAWRVPAFALLAGYFSHAGALRPRTARPLALAIVVPYLAVGLLHTLERRWATGEWRLFLEQPAWAMWFLLSLLCWRLALPYLARLRHPLTWSVAAALAAGLLPAAIGGTLELSRTLAFLPFFVLGWRLREGMLARVLRTRWSAGAAAGVLAAGWAAGWLLRDDVRYGWLVMKTGYEEPRDVVIRAAVLLAGAVVTLSFVRLMPRRRLPLVTYLGAGGMYIYLLHPLALRALYHAGFDTRWVGPWPDQLALLCLAVLLATALASPPVRRLARPIIQPSRRNHRAAPPRQDPEAGPVVTRT